MKKSIVTVALLIALMPYEIGIGEYWKNIFITVGGLLIIFLVLVPRNEKTLGEKKKDELSFAENRPTKEKEQLKNTNEDTIS